MGEVAGVVEREDTDVVAPADLEAVNAAIGRHDPGRLFRCPVDSSDQVQCQKADRPRVRINGDLLTLMRPQDLPKAARASPQELPVALAVGYYMVNVAVDERVVVLG